MTSTPAFLGENGAKKAGDTVYSMLCSLAPHLGGMQVLCAYICVCMCVCAWQRALLRRQQPYSRSRRAPKQATRTLVNLQADVSHKAGSRVAALQSTM